MKVRFKTLISLFLLIVFVTLTFVFTSANPLFLFVIIIWFICISYAYNDLDNRGILFVFLIAFFVFLLGRDAVTEFLGLGVENFSYQEENHAWISFIISLVSICSGYIFFTNYNNNESIKNCEITFNITSRGVNVKKLCKYIFYVLIMFSAISRIQIINYVKDSSFTDYYVDYSTHLKNNELFYFISKLELAMPIAWSIYLGTFPKKQEIKTPLIVYFIYLLISLGTGQRSTSMLGILTIFVYFTLRNSNEETWITKKMLVKIFFILPFLAVFISLYEIWREGNSLDSFSFYEGLIKFFYDQGVTSNVVKRAYTLKDVIPKQIYTLEFMHSGVLARIFNIPVYHGNNMEHALYGGSFTHTLAYFIMNASYLSGRGTGSSYIAELYQDFGYLGIVFGNLFYSFILARLSYLEKDKYIKNGYKLFIMPFILWAIRGSFTYFISQSLSPITLLMFIFFYLVNYLNKKKISNRTPVELRNK